MQSVIRRLLTSSQGCGGRNLQPPPRRGTSARCARRLPDCWPTGFAAVLLREGQRGDLLSRFQRVQLLHFPQALSHPTQSELFCNNRSIARVAINLRAEPVAAFACSPFGLIGAFIENPLIGKFRKLRNSSRRGSCKSHCGRIRRSIGMQQSCRAKTSFRPHSKCRSISEHNGASNASLPAKKAQASRYAPVAPM